MKIWFVKLNKDILKNVCRQDTLYFNLDSSKSTFNLETFCQDLSNLKIDITYFLLVLDMNSTIHNSFIFFKLNNYHSKNKLLVSLYNIVYKIVFNCKGNQKSKFKGAYFEDPAGQLKFNNSILILVYTQK